MSTTVFCEQCGEAISPEVKYCAHCGAAQDDRSQAEPAASAPQSPPPPPPPPLDGGQAMAAGGSSLGQLDMSGWPVIAGLPVELWLVIAAFAVPGGWLTIKIITLLPDAFKLLGATFFGFRLGLALLLVLVLVGLVGVAMLVIALRLYRVDRVGRGLAFAFAGTIVISVAFSNGNTAAATWAMILSLVGILILGLAPRVRSLFSAAEHGGPPTSVVVSRTLIAAFSAVAIVVALIYFLLATISGKYAAAGIITLLLAVGAILVGRRLDNGDRQARLVISIGAGAFVVLLLIFGRALNGLLIPIGLAVTTVGFLWLPNDARAFFGDGPLVFGAQ